jgi:hypothetical protein
MAITLAKLKKKAVKMDKDVLSKVQSEQWESNPVWEEDEPLMSIPSGSYTFETKTVPGFGGGEEWECKEAVWFAEGVEKPLRLRYRSGEEPDDSGDLTIMSFTALRNWPTDATNPKIKTGDSAIFCING